LKTYLDCYPCFLKQALRAARLSGADETHQYSILQQTLSLLQNFPSGAKPPEIVYQIQQYVYKMVKVHDPYRALKEVSTQQTLALYPKLKAIVHQSEDPLDLAIRLSIAGNIIDFGMRDQIADLWETMERILQQPYAIDDSAALIANMKKANHLLYLADNAGETVFDRILIEELPIPVIYAVKGSPVLNDAIMQDALRAGLESCATLIDNGSQALGTILSLCSETFRKEFENAPMIIAKGQANYETLDDARSNIFYLLQVKCPIIGLDLDVPEGSIVVRQSISGSNGDLFIL
jgi:uncharacterized protein with ATP-grasp and redox domains